MSIKNVTSMDKIQQPIIKDNSKTIAQTIEESGLNSLEENPPSDDLYLAIQKSVALSSGRDEAWRKIAVSEITKVLKEKKVSGADEFAKSAFFPKKQKPDSLDGNSVAFPELDPWPDRVDGCSLLDEISSLIKEFIVLSKGEADAIGLWILHAWTLDAYLVSPILRITSPTKSCGKSSLLSIIGELVPNPILTANLTPATLFRLVDKHEVTLLLDEVDVSFKRNEDLISIVNSGYIKKTSKVIRCVGDKHESKSFQSWSAKVLCGIGRLSETTESRSIRIEIKKKKSNETTRKFSVYELDEFEGTKQKCLRFAMDNIDLLKSVSLKFPEGIGDRDGDNWRPLLSISEIAGKDWPQRAAQAYLELSGVEIEDEEPKVQLLEDIKNIFNMKRKEELPTITLLTQLYSLPERPWMEWKHGKPITDRELSNLLRGFKIRSGQFRYNGKKVRGYRKKDFLDAWERYLSGTDGTDLKNKGLLNNLSGTKSKSVPHKKNDSFNKNKGVPLVPAGASLLVRNWEH